MKIEKKLLPNSIIELIVEEDIKNMVKYKKQALNHLENNADIKGFRKWVKIPESVLIRKFWEEHINKLTIDFAIENIYKNALRSEKLIPVAQWEITEIISEIPLKIRIKIEVLPNIKIDPKYKDIKLKKVKFDVSNSEVENAIKEIETKFTKFEESSDENYKAQMLDRVYIDTQWYEWEKKLENTNMKNFPIVLWSNILVKWFEEQIVWAKINEKLKIPVNFPIDYHNKDYAWKNTIFDVEINKIEISVKPEFTPEFIEQLRWKKLDFEWFKELIKEEIKETKKANAKIKEETKLMEEFDKYVEIEIWENLLKHQIEKIFNEIKEDMKKVWTKISDYIESLKMDEETYKENNIKPIALKRLKWELILNKLDELEKIEISEEEMKSEINSILSKFWSKDVLSRLKELYLPNSKYYEELKQRIRYNKIIESFFE